MRGLAFALLAMPGMLAAQVIDTNRPGFSFSPNVVQRGQWQLETGISYDKIDSNSSAWSMRLAELRFGLANRLEGFVSSMTWKEEDVGPFTVNGLSDMAVGIKGNITVPNAATQMALLFQLNVL